MSNFKMGRLAPSTVGHFIQKMNPYYKINIGIISWAPPTKLRCNCKAIFAQVFTASQINFYKKNYYQPTVN
jgi:hypothetical protein